MNRLQTLFDYREHGDGNEPVELGPYLDKDLVKKMLYNKRILYVLRANVDNSLIKFGIGGNEHGKSGAWGRLHQYVNTYGVQGDYDCLGVKLFLIVGNDYNENVESTNSAVFRKEKFLKREFVRWHFMASLEMLGIDSREEPGTIKSRLRGISTISLT